MGRRRARAQEGEDFCTAGISHRQGSKLFSVAQLSCAPSAIHFSISTMSASGSGLSGGMRIDPCGVHQVHDRRVLRVAGEDEEGGDQRLVADLARGEIDAALVGDRRVAVHGGAARLHDGGRDERPPGRAIVGGAATAGGRRTRRAAAAAATQASLGEVIGGLCIKVDQAQLRSQRSTGCPRRRCWLKCDPRRVPQRPPKQAFRAKLQPPRANFRRGDGQRPPV